jgi:hypothetical protein
MSARSTRLALALMIALPATVVAQGFEYAPGASQYRVTQNAKITQDMMGQKTEIETKVDQLLSVTIARASKDTLAVTAVIDSITASNNMGMPVPPLAQILGLKVTSKISPAGVVYSTEPPKDASPMAAQFTESLGGFLPKLRGALAKGSTWTDTTTGKTKQFGLDVDRRTVSKYTVVGDTTVAGEKSWRVDRENNIALSGAGTSQGQAMTLEGTSTGKGSMFVTPKGVFLAGEGVDESNVKIVLAASGAEVNVTGTTNTKVAKVK